jgi:uncharacterized membrane protein YphA (DoxX/SURF4 family)
VTSHWDDDRVGDYDEGTGKRRRWWRPWNQYLAVMSGVAGAFVVIGTLPRGVVGGAAGGLCFLAASFAVVRADGPKPTMRQPVRRAPSLRTELSWYAVAVVLVVVGSVLIAV